MANPEHLAKLKEALDAEDISIWNSWMKAQRHKERDIYADLSGIHLFHANFADANLSYADLSDSDLGSANFSNADLTGIDLSNARLIGAEFDYANLTFASLSNAKMGGADFIHTDLIRTYLNYADLNNSRLRNANFDDAIIEGTDFNQAIFDGTILDNLDLAVARNLENAQHFSPSSITITTLYKSGGNIPDVFLRGCGVPETMITFAKSLVGKPIQYYSAFISYSSQDEHFARRLHNDLQMNGVRVWFAPEDLKIGEPIEDSIDQAIRMYDKLILVLSQNSIDRAWVKKEFSKAIEKEKQHGKTVLFPIRLDDSVFDTTEQWAHDIRKRHIGDFRNWTNPLLYQNAINRLLRGLNSD